MNWEAMTLDERDWLIHEVVILGRKWTHEPVVCPAYTQSMDASWLVLQKMAARFDKQAEYLDEAFESFSGEVV